MSLGIRRTGLDCTGGIDCGEDICVAGGVDCGGSVREAGDGILRKTQLRVAQTTNFNLRRRLVQGVTAESEYTEAAGMTRKAIVAETVLGFFHSRQQ